MNLLFEFEDETLAIDSELPNRGRITFRARKNVQGLHIRIPRWVNKDTVRIVVAGEPVSVTVEGSYARIGAVAAGRDGRITFDIPCKREQETVDGVTYTTTWVGNQVIDIKPRGTDSPLPF
jgi:DUF1680 family protein